MSMGYTGYVKLDDLVVLTTGASVKEVVEPIYSDAMRGSGWYDAGMAISIDDVVRYDGSMEFELHESLWTLLKDWIVEKRTTSKTLMISPDGTVSYNYEGGSTGQPGSLTGAWTSSANFSTSEGSLITGGIDVLAFYRVEDTTDSSYINKATILNCTVLSTLKTDPNTSPYPFWMSVPEILVNNASPFNEGTEYLDWSISISQNPVVVYACTKHQGPLALMMGEMEASADTTVYNQAGVNGFIGATASNSKFKVTIDGTKIMLLPAVAFEGNNHDVQGADSFVSRAYSMKGLALCADRLPAFHMT